MKYVKVTIQKNRNEWDTKTGFVYPKWYDATKFEIVSYQNEWLVSEYAIAKTDDTFIASEWLEEITLEQSKQLINDFVTKDKDVKVEKLAESWKTIESIIKTKQDILWE